MKKIIYGNTGYGKSYNYVAPIIREKNNLILITSCDLKSELKHMNLPCNIIDEGVINAQTKDFGKIAISLLETPEIYRTEELFKLLAQLEGYGMAFNEQVTVILINFPKAVNDRSFISRLERWKANVVIEHLCTKDEIERFVELDYIMKESLEWEKVAVFTSYKNT